MVSQLNYNSYFLDNSGGIFIFADMISKSRYCSPECEVAEAKSVPVVLCGSPDEGCIEGLEIEDWVTGEE